MANSKKQPENLVHSGGPRKNHGSKQTAAANRTKQLEAKRAAERQVFIDQKEATDAASAAADTSTTSKTSANGNPTRRVQAVYIDRAARAQSVATSTHSLQRLTPKINRIAAATFRSMRSA